MFVCVVRIQSIVSVYPRLPELVNDFRVAAGKGGAVYDTDCLRLRYMRAYRQHADDAFGDLDASVTGASAMRDRVLFPAAMDVEEAEEH